jgi:GMP synthase-like glutamine amidotransferase
MKVLIIKNVVSEGPGTILDFLKNNNISFRVVEAGLGEPIPSLNTFSSIVIMGGPMGVYEMEQYPFLKDVASTIEKALKINKKSPWHMPWCSINSLCSWCKSISRT